MLKKNKLTVSDIAAFLSLKYIGENIEISSYSALSDSVTNSVTFSTRSSNIIDDINRLIIVDVNARLPSDIKASVIYSGNPRLDFIKVLRQFFAPVNMPNIAGSAKISDQAYIGNDVSVGHYSIIGDGVVIGDRTKIGNFVVVERDSKIGNDCIVKSSSILGDEGFGFEKTSDGVPIRFPHLGNVVIGNNVEIGNFNTIVRGSLGATIIGDNVKLDDHVHIAHNCVIGSGTMITACSELSGSVVIGRDVWIGPNSSVRDGVSVGDKAFVGIGGVIQSDLSSNVKVGSVGAMPLRAVSKLKKFLFSRL